MASAVVSSKGQIVIPAAVREDLAVRVGTRVDFVKTDEGWLLKPATLPVTVLKGIVPKPKRPVSLADMDRGIAAHLRKSFRRK